MSGGARRVLVACADPDRTADVVRTADWLGLTSERFADVETLRTSLARSDHPAVVVVDEALPRLHADSWPSDAAVPVTVVLLRSLADAGRPVPAWASVVLAEPVRESRLVEALTASALYGREHAIQ